MSKGSNIFNHFKIIKPNTHKDISLSNKMIHCSKINDVVSFTHTSSGILCNHCKENNVARPRRVILAYAYTNYNNYNKEK